jgi:imidazolonepropionase-like amidohydrolase
VGDDGKVVQLFQKGERKPDRTRYRFDGQGRTLLPGLIDAHVHVFPGAQADALRFGVTTELDMFNLSHEFTKWRAQRESLAPTAEADTWSAGTGVSSPGGHPSKMMPDGFPLPTLVRAEDAEPFVAARVAEGSDYIKLILEEISIVDPAERLPTLSREALCAAIAAAHAHHRMTLVHVSEEKYAREAGECGVDGLAHLFWDKPADRDFIAFALRRHLFIVPTLSVIAGITGLTGGRDLAADPRVAPFLSAAQKRTLLPIFEPPHPQALANALAGTRALHAAGVPLLAGTDAPAPGGAHGVSMHGELQLLVKAGLTPREALAAATSLPARYFHLAGRGCIAKGCRADLILVKGDPLKRIEDTLSIETIWKNGYAIDRRPAR